jgi:hypothetical protein
MTTRATMDERVDVAEGLLVQCKPVWQVKNELAQKYRVTIRQAREYTERVRERWAREAGALDRSARRNAIRASVEDIYSKAISQTRVLRDQKGKPVTDPKTKKPILIPVPDLRGALRAAQVLIALDGLAEPFKVEGVVDPDSIWSILNDAKRRKTGYKKQTERVKEKGKKRGRGGRKS